MPGYHKYVFDSHKREFVGRFDEMYQAELAEGFDAWNQDDLRARADAAVCNELLHGRFYDAILDLGCGKGALTAHLARYANRVFGTDISPTAIDIARRRYPQIQFEVLDASDSELVSSVLHRELSNLSGRHLIVMSQVLSYLENWKQLLAGIAEIPTEILVVLYIPEEPIGFVKTPEELQELLVEYFDEISTYATADRHYAKLFRSRNMVGM
jgi:SAM-dependent methyltransferase